jgi:hypothetical protein
MNTANLQLEGVCVALSSVLGALRRKGLLTKEEIDAALASAEDAIRDDSERPETLSGANVEAICFPIRYLRAANRSSHDDPLPCFSEITSAVGLERRAR